MKKKLIRLTTISGSLSVLLNGQLRFLSDYFDVIGVASDLNTSGLKEVSEREGVRCINVLMHRDVSLLNDVKSLWKLIGLFRKEKPYIVHANTPKGSLLAMAAAWICRVPHRVYTVTGLRFETTTGDFRKLLITMEKITCWCATKVIPEGEGVKQMLLHEGITNKSLKVILHGNINGIDVVHFSREKQLEQQAEEIRQASKYTFCFVGRIVKDKGINELISAFVKLCLQFNNIRLLLVGPFEQELDSVLPETEYQIQNHSAVLYVGFQQDIRPYLVASDALVFPSYREGFPNVVLQAGAMGLPSIVTDINGCNEIIKNGVNGIIIPPRDEKALYDAMIFFVEHRNREVVEMAKEARPMIVERFEQHKVWEALLAEYQSLEKQL